MSYRPAATTWAEGAPGERGELFLVPASVVRGRTAASGPLSQSTDKGPLFSLLGPVKNWLTSYQHSFAEDAATSPRPHVSAAAPYLNCRSPSPGNS